MENKAISSDLIRGHIDTIILYTLLDGDKYAQQISDSVAEKSDNEYQINQATLYSSLKRLETLKDVLGYWHNAESGRRRYFKLTESGKKTIEDNLLNWSYSRTIIDKLINCDTPKERKIDNSAVSPSILSSEKNEPVENNEKTNINVIEQNITTNETNKETILPISPIETENKEIFSAQIDETEPIKTESPSVVKEPSKEPSETNFRLILGELIRSTEKPKVKTEELTPIVKKVDKKIDIESAKIIIEEKNIESEQVIAKFNDTIRENTPQITEKSNKIDFSDIVFKGEKEGYKVNVSSRKKSIKLGSIFINKVRFFSAMILFLITIAEFLAVSLIYKNSISLSTAATVGILVGLAVFPIALSIIFIAKPLKTSSIIKKDGILSCAIVIFNLILFTTVLNLLLETDFSNTVNLLLYLITPFLLYFDAVLYFICRYIFSRKKYFKNKSK